jgi:hypothetical protein
MEHARGPRPRVWIGIDAGRAHRRGVAADENGTRIRLERTADDEAAPGPVAGRARMVDRLMEVATPRQG